MSVYCPHTSRGACAECADRAQRAGVERNHAEVWRQVEEIAASAHDDGHLPEPDRTAAWTMMRQARGFRLTRERNARSIEQGK